MEPGDPSVRTLPGDAKLFGDMSDGAVLVDHPVHEKSPPLKGEPGVTVGHESLCVNNVMAKHI